jgi:hypothetical protein
VFTAPGEDSGSYVSAADGTVIASGLFAPPAPSPSTPIAAIAATRDGNGYWQATQDGNVYPFGDAGLQDPTAPTSPADLGLHLVAPIVGMAATPDVAATGGPGSGPSGLGYWLASADGGVFAFGDAPYRGSAATVPLHAPIVGIAPTADGGGYWLVASDGGVFSFGDASFFGSAAALPLNAPIVGIAPTVDGQGYELVAADGGVFTFGDAQYAGSLGGTTLEAPIVAIANAGSRLGYYLLDAIGNIISVGDAPALHTTVVGRAVGFTIT